MEQNKALPVTLNYSWESLYSKSYRTREFAYEALPLF